MILETVALGPWGGAGAPGSVGLESSRVVVSSGSPGGGNWLPSTDCPLAPEVRASRGLKERLCLPFHLPPLTAPPPPTPVTPLLGAPGVFVRSAVTTASTPRPRIPTQLPLPRGGDGGEEAELRQEAESELGVPHPVLALPLDPSPSPTTETKQVRVAREAALAFRTRRLLAPPLRVRIVRGAAVGLQPPASTSFQDLGNWPRLRAGRETTMGGAVRGLKRACRRGPTCVSGFRPRARGRA